MRVIVLGAGLLLAACGSDVTPEEQDRLDEQAIAEVEANQTPPPDMVDPEAITAADIERAKIAGMGCTVTRAEGGEAIAVVMPGAAYMKFDGAMDRFAPDAGSPEGPYGTRVKYDSGRHSMRLQMAGGAGEKVGSEAIAFTASLNLRDGRDRVLFETQGRAVCGS